MSNRRHHRQRSKVGLWASSCRNSSNIRTPSSRHPLLHSTAPNYLARLPKRPASFPQSAGHCHSDATRPPGAQTPYPTPVTYWLGPLPPPCPIHRDLINPRPRHGIGLDRSGVGEGRQHQPRLHRLDRNFHGLLSTTAGLRPTLRPTNDFAATIEWTWNHRMLFPGERRGMWNSFQAKGLRARDAGSGGRSSPLAAPRSTLPRPAAR